MNAFAEFVNGLDEFVGGFDRFMVCLVGFMDGFDRFLVGGGLVDRGVVGIVLIVLAEVVVGAVNCS